LITNHYNYTESTVAKRVLDNWNFLLPQFIKVYPTDYRRVIEEAEELKSTDDLPSEDEMVSETIASDGN
jgi:glutamate synthase (ferredoxin)